jgi:hypothetical protein
MNAINEVIKQTRQEMYVKRNIFAVEKQQILLTVLCVRACMWVAGCEGVCMRISACSLANPACNAYAPYYDVMWPFVFHKNFRNYLINGAIFGKKLLNIKGVF